MRSTIRIKNRTNYFDVTRSRTYNLIGNPNLFQSKKQKIEAYETRLYFQYEHTTKQRGSTFFYTLTYNDKSVPKYHGMNVFDYEDLRDLLNGAFVKKLNRTYHCKMKYFVGAELGEGKGMRGIHNNPHYHVIFFVVPEYGYEVISAKDFKKLVEVYWQGFEEGKGNYKEAKYGIARPGANFGLVNSFRAISYCAKYVTKDVKMKEMEYIVGKEEAMDYRKVIDNASTKYEYFSEFVFPTACPIVEVEGRKCFSMTEERFIMEYYYDYCQTHTGEDIYEWFVDNYAYEGYNRYLDSLVQARVRDKVNEFRNRHTNKVRISQGVGDYALEFINPLSPKLKLPTKKGYKERNLCGYYFRKLYYDVMKDARGNNIYVLNPLGFEYKLSIIDGQLQRKQIQCEKLLSFIDEGSLCDYLRSDCGDSYLNHYNTSVGIMASDDWSSDARLVELLERRIDYIKENRDEIFRRYSEWKLIYENRQFKLDYDAETAEYSYPVIDILGDYYHFLEPTIYTVDYSAHGVDKYLRDGEEDTFGYDIHPYFSRYIDIFHLLDSMSDYKVVCMDEKQRADDESREIVRKLFTSIGLHF